MATEVAKGAFLPALKYGASSPTRCEIKLTNPNGRRIKTYVEVDTGLIVREERRDDD
jgi:hypothetical protein